MRLSESEHIVLNWLKTKYKEENISRNSNRSPDFICPDESYEVKYLYRNTLVFNETQIEMMEKMNPIIVVVSHGEIVDKFKWSERNNKKYKIHITKVDKNMCSMRISRHSKMRLSALGNASDSLNDVLDRVLDLYEEVKTDALIEEKMK